MPWTLLFLDSILKVALGFGCEVKTLYLICYILYHPYVSYFVTGATEQCLHVLFKSIKFFCTYMSTFATLYIWMYMICSIFCTCYCKKYKIKKKKVRTTEKFMVPWQENGKFPFTLDLYLWILCWNCQSYWWLFIWIVLYRENCESTSSWNYAFMRKLMWCAVFC